MVKRKGLRPEPIVKITSLQNILASAQNRLSASSRRLFAPADSESSRGDERQHHDCSDAHHDYRIPSAAICLDPTLFCGLSRPRFGVMRSLLFQFPPPSPSHSSRTSHYHNTPPSRS